MKGVSCCTGTRWGPWVKCLCFRLIMFFMYAHGILFSYNCLLTISCKITKSILTNRGLIRLLSTFSEFIWCCLIAFLIHHCKLWTELCHVCILNDRRVTLEEQDDGWHTRRPAVDQDLLSPDRSAALSLFGFRCWRKTQIIHSAAPIVPVSL